MTAKVELEAALRRALALAPTHRFRVLPNPRVGAVVLDRTGTVVGEGATEPYGGKHAEIVALEAAGELARGGTLVSTLEPCAHERKKTPPCAPAIVRAGIARVLSGCADPNPATAGQAAALFAEQGIEVLASPLPAECAAQIARYARHLGAGVPWTIGKWAMSADGRTADDDHASRWITGPASRRSVHAVRGRVEAVVVGVDTVLADDPSLTCRESEGSDPIRVVFDSRLRMPLETQLVQTARQTPTWVVTCEGHGETADRLRGAGVEVVAVAPAANGRVDPRAAFEELHARGIRRLLCEGGGTLLAGLWGAGLVHQVMAFVAPMVIGGIHGPRPFSGPGFGMHAAPRLEEPSWAVLANDALLEAFVPPLAAESTSSIE